MIELGKYLYSPPILILVGIAAESEPINKGGRGIAVCAVTAVATVFIKVKTIVTLIVIGVFAVLALRGDITSDNVLTITASVISFYFGTQHEKKNATDNANKAFEANE